MQNPPEIRSIQVDVPGVEEVLSPESHVFVALMSVEEGPDQAVLFQVPPAVVGVPRAVQAGPEE